MLLQSSIYGFVSSIALWSVLLLLVTITYLFKGINLNIQYIFLYYFIMIISGGLMFTFCTMLCSFVTNKSNCYYAIILGLFCINMIFNLLPSSYYDVYGPFSSLSYFTAYCGSHAIDYPVGYDIRYTNLGNSFVSFILLFILAIPSVFFTIKNTKEFKAYNANEVSKPIIFKVLLPISTLILMIIFGNIMSTLLLIIAYFPAWFIYHQGVKFNKFQIVSIIILTVSAILILNV